MGADMQRGSFEWTKKAAIQGIAEAQFQLAEFYYHGDRVAKNHQEAVKWYKEAALQGYEAAIFALIDIEKSSEFL